MNANITREQAVALIREYNKERFHLLHALTLEGVMRWYAQSLGYGDDADFWGLVGLLHDIDFELYPDEHCLKAPELLRKGGASEELIRAVCCHGWGLTGCELEPEHEMEKVLFAADELTGLIGALVLMLPSKSVEDVQLKSLKKKFKDKKFAAGCSRDVIAKGTEILGWELEKLQENTILAMQATYDQAQAELETWA